jgi:hypothetical protein
LAGAFPNNGGLFGYRNDRKLMNMIKWIMICLLAVALAPVGCGKKESQPSSPGQAVRIDVPKLQSAFATASPELKAMSDEAIKYVQFGRNYSTGLATLEKLAGSPGLTEEQKKVVDEVTAQVKQIMSPAAAPPAQ